jgi:peptidoglycan/xylan/chitin deacetylase (PgdA/CDA1 family)
MRGCIERDSRFIGWPDGKRFCFVLRHDVETNEGYNNSLKLLDFEKEYDFKSSFNLVPHRYEVSFDFIRKVQEEGFEIGIHGLLHDGKLYFSKKIFDKRVKQINKYMHDWDSVGFYSPSAHCNLEWIKQLDIQYDSSTFDTDPFEPQPEGCCTIFPFLVKGEGGYIEIPYTLPQDFTLFILMREIDTSIWKQKLDWIVENNGVALLNTHPDYMSFTSEDMRSYKYPSKFYFDFLKYVKDKYSGMYWNVIPKELSAYWRKHVIQ